jgi:hypothetical protein
MQVKFSKLFFNEYTTQDLRYNSIINSGNNIICAVEPLFKPQTPRTTRLTSRSSSYFSVEVARKFRLEHVETRDARRDKYEGKVSEKAPWCQHMVDRRHQPADIRQQRADSRQERRQCGRRHLVPIHLLAILYLHFPCHLLLPLLALGRILRNASPKC